MSTPCCEYLRVQLLSSAACAPARHSAWAAGYDLASAEDATVPPQSWRLVDTGVAVAVPPGTYGRVAPRSGLSLRGTTVGAGVIDADYRGPVKVLLFNHHPTEGLSVRRGDRIAQLVLEVIRTPEVAVVPDLDATERGAAGFGSTGFVVPQQRRASSFGSPLDGPRA
jgi:dUTP pyrophosphatase